MKKLLIFISLFFSIVYTTTAQSVTANQFNGRLQMTAVSNVSDSTWSITGYFTNSVNKYVTTQVAVNDKFFCQIGANTYVGRISVINSASDVTKLITFRVICNYPNPPNNIGAIVRATSNGYPVFVDGLPNALQAGIQNYFATLVNSRSDTLGLGRVLSNTNSASGLKIRNLGTPTLNGDATTKLYVDAQRDTSINRATRALRDTSKYIKTLFRKDTTISLTAGGTLIGDLAFEAIAHKYNNVHILLRSSPTDTGKLVFFLPYDTDVFRGLTFYAYGEGNGLVTALAGSDAPHRSNRNNYLSLTKGQAVFARCLPDTIDGKFRWYLSRIIDTLPTLSNPTITLSGAVTGSGTTSIVTALSNNVVGTANIIDGTVSLADHASNSVNSSKIVDGSVALADMAPNSVDNTKIVDYSITGTDLNYLTLRAGDATNPLMRWTAGAVLTTPVNGTWEWDANKLNFTIGGARKRIPVFNEATPSGGQLLIGNGGYDFTLANLTPGYAQTVTNGSGSITINPDTTKVIPFIPSAEIANGTRDGYFRNQTNFGHQFYNGGFTIFNNSTASTSAATGHSITKGGSSSTMSVLMTSANVPYVQIGSNDGTAKSKVVTFDVNGITSQVYNTTLSANSQSSATYQVDGLNGIERITNGTVTTVTLPEIVASPSTNQVGVGFMFTLVINSSSSVTIQRAGSSDVIERHGVAGTNTSFSAATGTVHVYTCIATGSDTWAIK